MGLPTHLLLSRQTSLVIVAALTLLSQGGCAQLGSSSTPSTDDSSKVVSKSKSDSSTFPNDPTEDRSDVGIRQNIEQSNKSITYELLKKNANKYEGEPWSFTGKIFQIQESGGDTFALLSLDGWGTKLVAVHAKFTTDFVDNNQVFVVGYLRGSYSYKSVAGWDMSVPLLEARAMLKPAEAAKIKSTKNASK